MAILLGELIPPLPSTYNTIINVLFLILGFLMLDKSFGFRTVYAPSSPPPDSGLRVGVPAGRPLTDELMLELFFAVILPALGPPFCSISTPPPAAPTSWP